MTKYEFQFKDMKFSKDGQLDELIALDRYAVTAFDGYGKEDTVIAIVDKDKGTKKVGTIIGINADGTDIRPICETQCNRKTLQKR
jgi:hypothetical protein